MTVARLLAILLVFGLVHAAAGATFYSENFNAGSGGYTGSSINPDSIAGPPGPWTYGASGVGGTGAWRTDGGESGNYPTPRPYEQLLTSPVITIPASNPVRLDFDHLYNFERDATDIWDGGILMASVNGGAFTQVPASAFLANGYTGILQAGTPWGFPEQLNGLSVFSGSSSPAGSQIPANDLGVFLHTQANLGQFNAGDTLQLQFRGGWDWFSFFTPAWVVDNVSLTELPEPSTLSLLAGASLVLTGIGAMRRIARKR